MERDGALGVLNGEIRCGISNEIWMRSPLTALGCENKSDEQASSGETW